MIKTEISKLKARKQTAHFGIRCAALILFSLVSIISITAQKKAVYTNPVVAGDYPDPSIIRVGKDYYATATSSEWSPEFPILHSRDLVNWEIVSDVFPKRPDWSVGNYWAPEIWQENGKFYVFYVARKKGANLCIAVATAAKPTGPYTDHGALSCMDAGSIDPFPIRDENGKLFVVWKEDGNSVGKPTPLWAQELDDKNYKLIGEKHELLRNDPNTWEGNLVEGALIVRRDGWFYLFYSGNACCGRECKYAMGMARSKTLLGTWEKSPANPILKGNEDWRCPGHGTIVSDQGGKSWLLYHAYDPSDTVYVGRQALLDEVKFTGGWATINDGKGPSKQYDSPLGVAERNAEYKFFDDFNAPNLRFGWVWQQNNVPNYRIEKSFLVLSPNASQSANEIGAIMARSTTVGDYTATTQINLSKQPKDAIAGISAYGDDENALGIGIKNGKLVVWKRERKNQQIISTVDAPKSAQLFVKMTARDGHFFKFATSGDGGKSWQDAGEEIDGAFLPPWDRGVRVALYTGGAADATARFGFLRIEPTK